MNNSKRFALHFSALAALALMPAVARPAAGQNSSLYVPAQDRPPMMLSEGSWTYQTPEEPKTVKINDLVTVNVEVKAQLTSDGKMDRKKLGYTDLKLPAWIKFYGLNLGEDKQDYGVPHVRGEVDNKLQSQANLESKDMLKFNIACRVVDIRPNGNLVLEGSREVHNNEEVWEYTLTGECRAADILPPNIVKSDYIADLKIIKREAGHVRDGYRRGWALEWLDKWQPF